MVDARSDAYVATERYTFLPLHIVLVLTSLHISRGPRCVLSVRAPIAQHAHSAVGRQLDGAAILCESWSQVAGQGHVQYQVSGLHLC